MLCDVDADWELKSCFLSRLHLHPPRLPSRTQLFVTEASRSTRTPQARSLVARHRSRWWLSTFGTTTDLGPSRSAKNGAKQAVFVPDGPNTQIASKWLYIERIQISHCAGTAGPDASTASIRWGQPVSYYKNDGTLVPFAGGQTLTDDQIRGSLSSAATISDDRGTVTSSWSDPTLVGQNFTCFTVEASDGMTATPAHFDGYAPPGAPAPESAPTTRVRAGRTWTRCSRVSGTVAAREAGVPRALNRDTALRQTFGSLASRTYRRPSTSLCGDFDGDGRTDRALLFQCCTVSSPAPWVVLRKRGSGWRIVYKRLHDTTWKLEGVAGDLVTTEPRYSRNDALCCASQLKIGKLRWTGRSFRRTFVIEDTNAAG